MYNKALKRFEPKYGLYEYEARNGYKYLSIGKLGKNQSYIEAFSSSYDGINLLRSLSEQFKIDYRFCNYGTVNEGALFKQPDNNNLPEVIQHNQQVESALDFFLNSRPSFAILDKGRDADERSCIWVENGHFYGMGYITLDTALAEVSELKEYVTPYSSNQYVMQLINGYAEKFPGKVRSQK